MAGSRYKRSLAAVILTVLGFFHAWTCRAQDRDKVAAAREAYAKAAGSTERQSAALHLGHLLLRRAEAQPVANGQPQAAAAAAANGQPQAAADVAEAAKLFREVVAAGGRYADEGEAGLLAAMLARDAGAGAGAAEAVAEVRRLQASGRGTDALLCMAMTDLEPGSGHDATLAANDELNDRIHSVFPTAPYVIARRISKPEKISAPPFKLSPEERDRKLGGQVAFQAVLDTQGHFSELLVLVPGPYALADSAAKAIRKWTYRPALLDGTPVPFCFRPSISVAFQK